MDAWTRWQLEVWTLHTCGLLEGPMNACADSLVSQTQPAAASPTSCALRLASTAKEAIVPDDSLLLAMVFWLAVGHCPKAIQS